jgi:hypothetical protein
MADERFRTRLARVALFGLVTGGLVAVPLVLAGEKRYGAAGLLSIALMGSAFVWLDGPVRLRRAWRSLRRRRPAAATPAVVRGVAAQAPPDGVPVIARARPVLAIRRYKPASRGRQVTAITSLAARGRDAQSIARELRVPYDVVQFALARRVAA